MVRCTDRDNFGYVDADLVQQVRVRFLPGTEHETVVTLPRSVVIPCGWPGGSARGGSEHELAPVLALPKATPRDRWAIIRLLKGLVAEGDTETVSGPFRDLVDHLADLPLDDRPKALHGFLCGRPDRLDFIEALANVDPEAQAPEVEAPRRPATLADLRGALSEVRWLWDGWIPAGRICGIGAFEGVGKTRFALDLARRIWHRMPWPDGQEPTLPAGTPTLWLCADGNQDDLAEAAQALGLPDEAIVFNTVPEDIYGGADLDNGETLILLAEFLPIVRPGLVFIDTLTNATGRNLCRQDDVKSLMAPLKDLAQRHQATIIPQLHLSKDGQALGRRIKGITRTLIQMECPDPARPERLRLWVEKTYARRPPALGVTITDSGNEYDTDPPKAPERDRGGRPASEREKAVRFIAEALTEQNDRKATDLCKQFVEGGGKESTFWNARDAMVEAGDLVCEGKPKLMHLVRPDPGVGDDGGTS